MSVPLAPRRRRAPFHPQALHSDVQSKAAGQHSLDNVCQGRQANNPANATVVHTHPRHDPAERRRSTTGHFFKPEVLVGDGPGSALRQKRS
jgi:hypothetical protein